MTDFAHTLTLVPPDVAADRAAFPLVIDLRARVSQQPFQATIKRALDIVVSVVALVLVLPLLLLIALLVRLDSRGNVIFRQERMGAGGDRFKMLKFRTMVADAEAILRNDPLLRRRYEELDFKLPAREDPRITRIGRFLRRTSLDELPQLWNVLRGDMSLVGARPIEAAQVPQLYGANAPLFISMRPGLTGHWQVSGRSHLVHDDRARLDLHYITNWSILEDLRILFKTIPAVLSKRGAH